MFKPKYVIPQPSRVRRIGNGSFAWIDHRLLRRGHLARMTHHDQSLYLFLVLAADRNGVSFYRKEKVCDLLDLDFGQFEIARDRLVEMGLVAFEPYRVGTPNGFHQVLSLDDSAAKGQTLLPQAQSDASGAAEAPPAAGKGDPFAADLVNQLAQAFRKSI